LVKVNAKILGYKTPIEIKTTTKNVRQATVMMRNTAQWAVEDEERSEANSEDPKIVVEVLTAQINRLNELSEFITDTLHLNAQKAEKLEDLEVPELQELANEIMRKVLQIQPGEDTESDQKSDAK